MNKPISWFEIPVADFDRARNFYETAFGIKLYVQVFGPSTLAVFPYDRNEATGGALIHEPNYQASTSGTIVYLNAGNELDDVVQRATNSGASVLLPRTALPPGMGFYAQITDTEGNRIGLHGLG